MSYFYETFAKKSPSSKIRGIFSQSRGIFSPPLKIKGGYFGLRGGDLPL